MLNSGYAICCVLCCASRRAWQFLLFLPDGNKFRESCRMGWAMDAAGMGRWESMWACIKLVSGSMEVWRRGCRCENNINISYKGVGLEDVWWPKVAEDVDQCELSWTRPECFRFHQRYESHLISSQKGLYAPWTWTKVWKFSDRLSIVSASLVT